MKFLLNIMNIECITEEGHEYGGWGKAGKLKVSSTEGINRTGTVIFFNMVKSDKSKLVVNWSECE